MTAHFFLDVWVNFYVIANFYLNQGTKGPIFI